ncbi:hypothetical protein [Flagellimonas lutaonensis]|uniref:Outer membrane protein beta-barrel domain-containing protein n=1 Tax=Flagellimonas lutaonensis TaxID=516051 RepID=A0A0D5YQ95_9FLAO|nr:hypothetical protein [Allomuricauda lutaonensis]AKA34028.1 hypothetical protein VC82_345 [Allomuricauda lutaonensis]
MRKATTTFFMCLLAIFCAEAQVDRDSFRAGFHAQLPIGDAGDVSSFGLGLDLAYHVGVNKLIDLGVATGFTNAFGKTETVSGGGITIEAEFDNVQFLPIAALVRLYPTKGVNFGADVGYAVGISSGNDGGLYYRPTLAFTISGTTELALSYTGVELDGGSWNTVNAGVLFLF